MNLFRPPFSLLTLQVFVLVARLGSFTRAAEHVNLTQSAVSKQIALLEDYFGVALFLRAGGVTLTPAGAEFLAAVEPALARITSAAQRLRESGTAHTQISLVAPPAVLQFWLISLLPQFAQEHPEIQLKLRPKLVSGGVDNTDADAEIRFGSGVWQGIRAQYLFGREMCVVASPGFLSRHTVKTPEDLSTVPLMRHVLFPSAWSEWHSAMGVPLPMQHEWQDYDHYSVMIEAIIAQLGVGIIPRLLVRKLLATGELTAPFDEVMVGSSGYYLVLNANAGNPAVLRFVGDWLKQQADALVQEWLARAARTVSYVGERR